MKSHYTTTRSILFALALIGAFLASPAHRAPQRTISTAPAQTKARAQESFGKLPLYFVENRGQTDARVGYYVQGGDKAVYFTERGLTFVLNGARRTQGEVISEPASYSPPVQWALKLDFVGARAGVRPEGETPTEAVISYFKGHPSQWKTGLRTYAQIRYRDLWPGIDLVYAGTVNRMKYTFVVRPGADPNQIKLAYRGASGVAINAAGELAVRTPVGGFTDDRPVSFQETDGRQSEVATSYRLADHSALRTPHSALEYGFAVGDYDRSRELVIDPAVFVYAGYIGGSGGGDTGFGIAVDSAGNAYVTGTTNSTQATFPDGDGFGPLTGPDTTFNGATDAFVAKLNAAGTALVYAGYIGGSGNDRGLSIAVDSAGNAYVTGDTNSTEATFPDGDGFGALNGPDTTSNGNFDAFVAKVNVAGTALVYAGYIGGSLDDFGGQSIAVDGAGNAYIIGQTASSQATFPDGDGFGKVNGPDLTHNGGGNDAYIAKISADGTTLVYAGYIGGSGADNGGGIAVDNGGSVYVTGFTASTQTTFPDGDGFGPLSGPDTTYNGGTNDAFVAKINAAGTALVYAGYIGGSFDDNGFGIAVDSAGNAYIAGRSNSTQATFPDGDGFGPLTGPDTTYNGGTNDAFVAKVNAAGTALVYAGYLGGSGDDQGFGIAVDSAGNAYLTGSTNSTQTTFPDGDGFGPLTGPDTTFNGGTSDAFGAKVNAAGTALVYAGYLGGSGSDQGFGIALDSAGNAYVTGQTSSTEATFPDGDGFGPLTGPDTTFNGGFQDAFVAKIHQLLVVDTMADTVAADGFCSLREAIQAANTDTAVNECAAGLPGLDTITFGVTGTINLTSALPAITSDMMITGPSPSGALIVQRNAGTDFRIFTVSSGTVTISSLTIANGRDTVGGGISSLGNLTITDCTITGNTATGGAGGGIRSFNSALTVSGSAITNNTASQEGGGVFVLAGTAPNITTTTFSGNSASSGAALYLQNISATLANCTLSGNTATGLGGGVYFTSNLGTAVTLTLQNNTVAANTAANGGGLVSERLSTGAVTATLRNTLVDANPGANFRTFGGATYSSLGNNLDSDGTSGFTNGVGGNVVGQGARLAPLAANGGLGQTRALRSDSPAIDAGTATGAPAIDQRNQPRPADGNGDNTSVVDIGAFETQKITVTNTNDGGAGSLRQAIADNNSAGGALIAFNISGGGVKTIAPTSELPAITKTVDINGYTQPGASANSLAVGNNAVLLIELNGTGAGAGDGLNLISAFATVRGLVINRFPSDGIQLLGADNCLITGNFIGTNAAGTASLGNNFEGVRLDGATNNVIGGGTPAARNLISGNEVGVFAFEAAGNQISGNYLGTNAAGTSGLANLLHGVQLTSTSANNTVQGNLIAFNTQRGVSVQLAGSTGNRISSNAIHANGNLGIDLSNDGVTANDAGDGDTGPNNLQNFPVINSVTSTGTANASLNSTASTQFTVEFFANTTCDGSGNGEGEVFLGSTTVNTDAGGNANNFAFNFTPVGGKPFITATATTTATGNTSEFSACRAVNTVPTITASAPLSRQQGSAAINAQIANVSDPDQAPGTLTVQVNDAASATVNGVTVSNLVNTAGTVTADVVASCTATNATFTLKVSDNLNEMNTATLTVNVTANTAPTLGTYPATGPINTGSGTTVTPNVAPTDNGSVATVTATAPSFTGSFSGNPTTGVITVSNAGPAGNYNVTVTATDNCGATINTTFTLFVNTAPTISAVTNARAAGSAATNSQIATVSDPDQALNTLTVQVNNGANATVNGVTVSNLAVSAGGSVSADIATTCAATNATFTLKVTDNLNLMNTVTLTVNVTANTTPTLGAYPGATVALSGGTTVTPSVAPTDNGSVTSVTASAPGFTGTLSGNATTGVLTVSNAGPIGNYTVTVTATDNCGVTAMTTFLLGVGAQTITVNTTADTVAADGLCSLREAIMAANTNAAVSGCNTGVSGLDNIVFALGVGTPSIAVTGSALPTITEALTMDGVTGGATRVELNGTGAGAGANGLNITAGNSTIKGLVINRFTASGILLQTNGGNAVQNCFIGTNAAGTAALANTNGGVLINATTNNLIGGTATNLRNVVSGNGSVGVNIIGAGATGNQVLGNYIGVDAGGTAAIANNNHGVQIAAPNNTVGGAATGAGNVISGNSSSGVSIGTAGNVVQGNFIGTNALGTAALGNLTAGVTVFGANNTIGGTTAAARNLISGNGPFGVFLFTNGATGNLVQGNYIGTNAAGTAAIGNMSGGVSVQQQAMNNTIGGTAAGAGNLISGNLGDGVFILTAGTTGNLVQGNLIGTNAAGTAALANTTAGVTVSSASGNSIGGGTAAARNVISGNSINGVNLFNAAASNLVQGNYIGTNAAGTAALPNGGTGVAVGGTNNLIGGVVAGEGNLISGNAGDGVALFGAAATGNFVRGNLIGTAANGAAALGNGARGVIIDTGSSNNLIGGPAGNTIAFNSGAGVFIPTSGSLNNSVVSNLIYSNGALGIDLGAAGVTANDAGDADTGANNLQNFPVLNFVTSGGFVGGMLDSLPANTAYPVRIEFFANTACDAAGNGEGEVFLGFVNLAAPGAFTFNFTPIAGKPFITATAIGGVGGNTSEFSACRVVNTVPAISASTPLSRQQGSAAINATIAAVADPDQAANTLTVEVNNGTTATVNGVTVSNLAVNGAGAVTADIGTTCAATNATFTLKVTDNLNLMNTATLTVNVTANTAPTLGTYPTTTVALSGGTTVTPSSAPTDNGSIATLTASAPGFSGTLSGNPATGVITVSNAAPAGNYTVTVTATDNCGAMTTRTFTLGVGAQTITVNTTADAVAADGVCSLREAITAANTNAGVNECGPGAPGLDNIAFSLGAGTPSIAITSALPAINEPLSIDGATGGATRVEINGAGAGQTNGLNVNGGGTTLKALVINRFTQSGVVLQFGNNNTVQNCFIGTNAAGTAAQGNTLTGVRIVQSNNNLIGGASFTLRNVIAGNGGDEIFISGATTTGNQVQGNLIGTNAAGTAALAGAAHGVRIQDAPGNTIGGSGARLNVISGNNGHGVSISGATATGNFVQGNIIGADANGLTAIANGQNGVAITDAGNNLVGSATAGLGNVISGNAADGVVISGAGATGNQVLGNFIGLNANGTEALGNVTNGVRITDAPANRVGDTSVTARNVIAGNGSIGVRISGAGATGNQVQGNYIGTNAAGTAALANGANGVSLSDAGNNTVGGTAAGAGNVISGNTQQGVFIGGATATGNQVLGNLIGTNAAGTASLANGSDGVRIDGAPTNTIGGTVAGARNVISGNTQVGINIFEVGATGNVVQGNFIGTNAAGTTGIPNAEGVNLNTLGGAGNNLIGGTTAAAGNLIAFNLMHGVLISTATNVGNSVLGNRIFNNGTLGIDLAPSGITQNDAGDGDAGPNGLQNFPLLTAVSTIDAGIDSTTTFQGTLNSTANTDFRLEFFSNPMCDASGNGEGRGLLGFTEVTTNASGNAVINITLPTPRLPMPLPPLITAGDFVTATATNLTTMSTSEFSPCVCSFGFLPPAAPFTAAGGSGSFGIITAPTCSWTVTLNPGSFVVLNGTTSGTGNGTVSYTVPPQAGLTLRSDLINVTGPALPAPNQLVPVAPNQVIITQAGNTGMLIQNQNFAAQFPPPGWTNIDGGTGSGQDERWLNPPQAGTLACQTPANTGFPNQNDQAFVNAECADPGNQLDERFVAPPFNATGMGAVFVEFLNQFRAHPAVPNNKGDVDVSIDGGLNWMNVLRLMTDDGTPNNPTLKTLNLTPFIGLNAPNVLVRLRYTGTAPPSTPFAAKDARLRQKSPTGDQFAYWAVDFSIYGFGINPMSNSFTAAGGTGAVNVVADAGRPWMAACNVPWITNLTPPAGNGNGTVSYTVQPNTNPGGTGRIGTCAIAGNTFTVTQLGQACTPITLNPAALANGFVGAAYSQMLTATGGTPAYTFSVTSGALPTGLMFNGATGALTGTPTVAGVFNFTVGVSDNNTCPGSRSYTIAVSSNNGLQFYPLPRPLRLLDTRADQSLCDNVGLPITGGTALTTQARITCNGLTIPANAQAIVGNVTVINQTASFGFLTLFPAGQTLPLAANIIYEPGQLLSNNFTVGLNANGEFSTFAERTLHTVIDVSGYFAPPGAGGLFYHALPRPLRLLDTRADQSLCDNVGAPITGGTALTTQARITCNGVTIPAAAQAIVGNATVINQTAQFGFMTLFPSGQTLPLAANMIYAPNQLLANYFTVGLNANGQFDTFGERTIHAVIDVAGYYSTEAVDANGPGLLFNPLPRPLRLLDTRADQSLCDNVGAPIAAGTSLTTQARITCQGITIPAGAQTVNGNITVINTTASFGFLTLFPAGQTLPLAANMIYAPSQLLSNAFVVGLSGLGEFNTFGERTIHVVVDVSGYFAP